MTNTKVQVQITYTNASGKTHTSGASFDSMESFTAYLNRAFTVEQLASNLRRIEFTKPSF